MIGGVGQRCGGTGMTCERLAFFFFFFFFFFFCYFSLLVCCCCCYCYLLSAGLLTFQNVYFILRKKKENAVQ